jgi:hypothetical protein
VKNGRYESLDEHFKKIKTIVGVTCWELKNHLFKGRMLPTFTYGIETWGGDFKNLIGRFLKRT